VSKVASPAGVARFLTLPRLPVPSVGNEAANLEDDVFHHSKMLLSSLVLANFVRRPGEDKLSSHMCLLGVCSIVIALALAQPLAKDYVILESEGVIKTTHADDRIGNQFYMELRRREPAEVVMNLLKADGGSAMDATSPVQKLRTTVSIILGRKRPDRQPQGT